MVILVHKKLGNAIDHVQYNDDKILHVTPRLKNIERKGILHNISVYTLDMNKSKVVDIRKNFYENP